MEEVVAALEEDGGQLGEEGLEVASDDLLLLLVDQSEDDLTGAVGIGPLAHLESILHLGLSQLQQELLAIGVVKLHRVRDLRVDEGFWIFLGFDQLLKVIVEGVGEAAVFSLAFELEAEGEKVGRYLIVEVQKLGVLAKGVHDDLGD